MHTELTPENIARATEAGIGTIDFFPGATMSAVISQTVRKDAIKTTQEALIESAGRCDRRSSDSRDSTGLFQGMFFDARKFDFSRVGRLKFNIKMGRPERERL